MSAKCNHRKVFVVGGKGPHCQITHMYQEEEGYKVTDNIEEADIVQFRGGADVWPAFYGHPAHVTTGYDKDRDREELRVFRSTKPDQIKVGICRGAQFLHVMNGGTLYQDVAGHAIGGTHIAKFAFAQKTREVKVSSTHHQMMRPDSTRPHAVIGFASLPGHRLVYSREIEAFWDDQSEAKYDSECILYPDSNSLCFQPHPEFVHKDHECRRVFFEIVEKMLTV